MDRALDCMYTFIWKSPLSLKPFSLLNYRLVIAQGIIFLLKFEEEQFQPMDTYFKLNFVWKKTATQNIFCIAVISKMHSKL